MISSLLIANRGEIARRIIHTARRLGVRTVAVYSEADADAPHVHEADEAVLIGPAPARESYLVAENILAAAKATGAEAIHPGYGFLSENADFAEAVTAAGLVWIGPRPAAIRAMGLKDAAKTLMMQAGVPVTPGYLGDDQSPERLAAEAAAIGWPVLIKAVAGGGGKGMRKVEAAGEFDAALAAAKREAQAAFGDDRVLLEKYVTRPRHIEVQVFGDTHGNVVHLFERDCSLQRRHQKVIEEAPAPGMDEATRQALCAAAVKAAKAVNYVGAGTIEFIADASDGLRADRIWFMEMNTRLQVEHPVTEAITGQDLVEWQLRVASGEPLPLRQEDLRIDGHAVEARLYAEDPFNGFLPSVGALEHFELPDELPTGLRIDSAVEAGGEVSPYYDPMIAKIIAHGETREAALGELANACADIEIWPVKTNAGFLVACLDHENFVDGQIDTGFIPDRLDELLDQMGRNDPEIVALGAVALMDRWSQGGPQFHEDPWNTAPRGVPGFRMNAAPRGGRLRLTMNGERVEAVIRGGGDWRRWTVTTGTGDMGVTVESGDHDHSAYLSFDHGYGVPVISRADKMVVFHFGTAFEFARWRPSAGAAGAEAGDGAIRSPMPGKIVTLAAEVGAQVAKGAPLVTLEAMKMEHAMTAPFDGTVAEVSVAVGDQVSEGAVLVRLEKAS